MNQKQAYSTSLVKNMIARNCTTAKLKTFTCKDAKLRRLLHKSRLRIKVTDITKLKYTEKNEHLHALEAAEMSLRRFRKEKEQGNVRNKYKYKQQSITNYFFLLQKHQYTLSLESNSAGRYRYCTP